MWVDSLSHCLVILTVIYVATARLCSLDVKNPTKHTVCLVVNSLLVSNIIDQYNNKNVNLSTVEMMTIDNCN